MTQQQMTTEGFLEALQTELAAASALSYTVGGVGANLFVDAAPREDARTKRTSLTLIEEGGELIAGGRLTLQERTVRFVSRSPSGPRTAKNNLHALLKWLEDHRWIQRGVFTIRWLRVETTPTVTAVSESGSSEADMVVSFLVTAK